MQQVVIQVVAWLHIILAAPRPVQSSYTDDSQFCSRPTYLEVISWRINEAIIVEQDLKPCIPHTNGDKISVDCHHDCHDNWDTFYCCTNLIQPTEDACSLPKRADNRNMICGFTEIRTSSRARIDIEVYRESINDATNWRVRVGKGNSVAVTCHAIDGPPDINIHPSESGKCNKAFFRKIDTKLTLGFLTRIGKKSSRKSLQCSITTTKSKWIVNGCVFCNFLELYNRLENSNGNVAKLCSGSKASRCLAKCTASSAICFISDVSSNLKPPGSGECRLTAKFDDNTSLTTWQLEKEQGNVHCKVTCIDREAGVKKSNGKFCDESPLDISETYRQPL